MKVFFNLFIFLLFMFFTNMQLANEILMYADSIDYDSEKNIIARGNAKLIKDNELISSNLIIYNKKKLKYIIPSEFKFKDGKNNYYSGSSGEFSKDLKTAEINNPKLLLSDGSRIVGKHLLRNNEIDIISKAIFSPCESKIKIANFICPIWQFEDEKMLHDSEKLFLYHKHSKVRVLNIPVAYAPYLVTPSPLRKKRKSGFLTPSIDLIFFDAQTSQSVQLPYYFALDMDKELYLTPTINYGAGVDSSQTFGFDYNQLISGGNFNLDVNIDSRIENENNETWFKDAYVYASMDKKLNEKFNYYFNTAFQSSPTYLRRSNIQNVLNLDVALKSSFGFNGSNLRKEDDYLSFNVSSYQVVKKNDDNSNSPTAFPYIKYYAGNNNYKKIQYNNLFSFYNIVRDKPAGDLAKRQQKFNHKISANITSYRLKSEINYKTQILTQAYHIEGKQIDGIGYTGYYNRVFPMSGIYIKTPIRNTKYHYTINPKASLIINSLQPSSNKVSNEESVNTSYSLLNASDLNRFKGSDKLDNSQRINYGISLIKNKFTSELSQSYEFNKHSDYNKEAGLEDALSDILFKAQYLGEKNQINYNNRINIDIGEIANQGLSVSNTNKYISTNASYSQARKETNSILNAGTETMSLSVTSAKFIKYNQVGISANYDLINDYVTQNNFIYSYIDECFAIDLNFLRNGFQDRDLKPEDTVTIKFSFKYMGTYKSTNLAVSEQGKQDIEFLSDKVNNNRFITITNED